MIFPVLCPRCQADSGARLVPESPEVETFRCGDCRHEWSEPVRATALKTTPPDPDFERRWVEAFQPHAT